MPFTVTKAIPAGELFWMALFTTESSNFSWGIYTFPEEGDNKFICRSYNSYRVEGGIYIIQSQDHLTQQIVPGDYLVQVNFKEKPDVGSLWLSVGYSTRQFYDDYNAKLENSGKPKESGSSGGSQSTTGNSQTGSGGSGQSPAGKYDEVGNYDSNGLARVFKGKITQSYYSDYKSYDGKYGLIDRNGKEILPVEYNEILVPDKDAYYNYLNYYYVRKDGKEWLVDKTGKQITDSRYDSLSSFRNGFAAATVENGIAYFIDRTGKRSGVIYDYILEWSKGPYYEVRRSGKHGVLDMKTRVVIPCEYDKLRLLDKFRLNGRGGGIFNNVADVKKGSACYVIILDTKETFKVVCDED
jgi:hypothetical protein